MSCSQTNSASNRPWNHHCCHCCCPCCPCCWHRGCANGVMPIREEEELSAMAERLCGWNHGCGCNNGCGGTNGCSGNNGCGGNNSCGSNNGCGCGGSCVQPRF